MSGPQEASASAPMFYAQTLLAQRELPGTHRQSLEVGAWLCLREAWSAWLNELLKLAAPKEKSTFRLNSLDELVAYLGRDHPEVQRLINLEQSPSNWLSSMLRTFSEATFPIAPSSNSEYERSPLAGGQLIPLNAVDAPVALEIDEILEGFKAYMMSVRAHMLEW